MNNMFAHLDETFILIKKKSLSISMQLKKNVCSWHVETSLIRQFTCLSTHLQKRPQLSFCRTRNLLQISSFTMIRSTLLLLFHLHIIRVQSGKYKKFFFFNTWYVNVFVQGVEVPERDNSQVFQFESILTRRRKSQVYIWRQEPYITPD